MKAIRHIQQFLRRCKYEVLLSALLLHLFNAVLIADLEVYTKIFWPLDMLLLGISSYGIFADRSRLYKRIKVVLSVLVTAFPVVAIVLPRTPGIMEALSVCYAAFYGLVFVEVMRHLIRPSYINTDIVSAAICGYLLLIEIGIFSMQTIYYAVPDAFLHLTASSFTATYLDIVYFCCVTVTSIGFGDVTPNHHISKLATSMLGIAGQFYSVVLVGLIISKYSASASPPSPPAQSS